MERLVPKYPEVPKLNSKAIELLTSLCFRENDSIQKVDVLFVFWMARARQEAIGIITELLYNQVSSTLILTGWTPWFHDSTNTWGVPESRLLWDELHLENYPSVKVIYEETSTNTWDNVRFVKDLYDRSTVKTIWFVSKYFHAWRAFISLQTEFPSINLIQYAYINYDKDNIVTRKEDRMNNEKIISKVRGEFLRIKEYWTLGYINTSSVDHIIKAIEKEIHS